MVHRRSAEELAVPAEGHTVRVGKAMYSEGVSDTRSEVTSGMSRSATREAR